MDSPIERYKTLQQIDNIKDIAYKTIFTKYVIQNLRGKNKMWEWESTDQESLMIAKNGGYPIPGSIYIFEYDKKGEQQTINTGGIQKDFYDVVPLVFCTSVKSRKSTFEGINFNFLPPLERVKLLEAYYRAYKNFFKDLEVETQNNELALNRKFIGFASSPIGGQLIKFFSKLANANFRYAYRKYSFNKIDNFRMIEYCEWNYIPFYEPKDAFKGANQKQIQSQYWKADKNI